MLEYIISKEWASLCVYKTLVVKTGRELHISKYNIDLKFATVYPQVVIYYLYLEEESSKLYFPFSTSNFIYFAIYFIILYIMKAKLMYTCKYFSTIERLHQSI
jgi:hypothetical protein